MSSSVTLHAGALRNRITIQQRSVTRNDVGEEVESWSTWNSVWAQIEPVSSREFLEARAQGAEISHRVTIRAIDGLTHEMRVLFGSRVLDIVGPPRDVGELGKKVELLCKESV